MKIRILCALAFIIFGCLDDSTTKEFDAANLPGIRVPYEITNEDKTVIQGPFASSSIFGVYAESIQFNEDGTYFPVQWQDENNYFIKIDEGGDFQYASAGRKLTLTNGLWDMELEVVKLTRDDLTIVLYGWQYKLKREIKL